MISMFLLDRISIVMRQCIQVSLKMFILRHTHCSLLFEAGLPIQEVKERLGHSDIKPAFPEIYNEDFVET